MYLLYALYVVYFLYGLFFLREKTFERSREKGPAALGKPQEKRGRTRVLQLECRLVDSIQKTLIAISGQSRGPRTI